MTNAPLTLLMLCTGNAARSVMAGVAMESRRPEATVITAGTHVMEGQPISRRTREAIESLGLTADHHRSTQLDPAALSHADLVLAMAREHVSFIRRRHPEAAARTATLQRLARDLPEDGRPLAERVAALDLGEVELEDWEDVDDPAGLETNAYLACAEEVDRLVTEIDDRL